MIKWLDILNGRILSIEKEGKTKKTKIFSKLIRELTVASKLGGSEVSDNPRLRLALDKALGANMPKDTIERAIARGAGDSDSGNLEEISYEGYGPNGVAILIEAMSDNKNRTVAEVRHAFSKCGGSLGTDGSVSYLFSKKGQIVTNESNQDKLLELLISEGDAIHKTQISEINKKLQSLRLFKSVKVKEKNN